MRRQLASSPAAQRKVSLSKNGWSPTSELRPSQRSNGGRTRSPRATVSVDDALAQVAHRGRNAYAETTPRPARRRGRRRGPLRPRGPAPARARLLAGALAILAEADLEEDERDDRDAAERDQRDRDGLAGDAAERRVRAIAPATISAARRSPNDEHARARAHPVQISSLAWGAARGRPR